MKVNDIHKFVILISFIFFSTKLFCQQNLFNIPSGDITDNKKVFYQHQFNLYNDKLESKSHFVYGLGKGWDVGINLVGNGFYFSPKWEFLYNDNPNKGSLSPTLMGSIQKKININEFFDINIGGQVGYNISDKLSNLRINYYICTIGLYNFMKGKSRIISGIYKTNQMFVGDGKKFGLMFGYEIKLGKRWYLMGDWVSGNNEASVGVFGGTYNLTRRVQVCAGIQFPNKDVPKPLGFVLELNLLPSDIF